MLIFQMRGLECKHLHRGDIQQLILEGSAASLRDQSETMAAAHPPGARPAASKTERCIYVSGWGEDHDPPCTDKQVACVAPGYLGKSYMANRGRYHAVGRTHEP